MREPKNYPCDKCDCLPDGTSSDGLKWKVPSAGIESSVCLRKLITDRTIMMLDLYGHYKNGVLPVAGGLLDQPYAYYRAMTIIDQWMRKDGDT